MCTTRQIVIKVRYALKMTQEQFAKEVDRSTRTVRRWEAGKTEGTMADLLAIIKLCKSNDVDFDTIVFIMGQKWPGLYFFFI